MKSTIFVLFLMTIPLLINACGIDVSLEDSSTPVADTVESSATTEGPATDIQAAIEKGIQATAADVAGPEMADTFYAKWIEGDTITADDLPDSTFGPGLFDGLDALEQLFPTPEGDEPR